MKACLKPMRNNPRVRVFNNDSFCISMTKHGKDIFLVQVELSGYSVNKLLKAKNWSEAVAGLEPFLDQVYQDMSHALGALWCISEFTTARA